MHIAAWAWLTNWKPAPWELDAIRRLDDAWMRVHHERQSADKAKKKAEAETRKRASATMKRRRPAN